VRIAPYDLDDDLIAATRTDGRARVRVQRYPDKAVVLGRGSSPETELHLDAIIQDGIPVMRRHGGGCAVLLDPGNLIVSVVWPLPGLGGIKKAFDDISSSLIAAIADAGLPGVTQEGISDLVLSGRKIGGSCIYRSRDLLYYSTTLLIDPDLESVDRYLKHPPREPGYRRGRSHASFMGSISESLGALQAERLALRLERNDLWRMTCGKELPASSSVSHSAEFPA
jgi:lipoate-protein ligase A